MTTLHIQAACIGLMALYTAYAPAGPLRAQSASENCGILTWSQADQKHSTLPCGASVQKNADGTESCGISTWSQSEQRQTMLPCASATAGDGKETCTMLAWSQADQRHVAIPCETSARGGLPAPVHFGE